MIRAPSPASRTEAKGPAPYSVTARTVSPESGGCMICSLSDAHCLFPSQDWRAGEEDQQAAGDGHQAEQANDEGIAAQAVVGPAGREATAGVGADQERATVAANRAERAAAVIV